MKRETRTGSILTSRKILPEAGYPAESRPPESGFWPPSDSEAAANQKLAAAVFAANKKQFVAQALKLHVGDVVVFWPKAVGLFFLRRP